MFAPTFYPIIKNLIEQSVASGLIYLNSSARDFQNPELRPYLDKYVRGSGGHDAEQRVKLMKLLWDAIGSEFGLATSSTRSTTPAQRRRTGSARWASPRRPAWPTSMKAFVQSCMAEYDLNGWTAPDLINPDDVSWLPKL